MKRIGGRRKNWIITGIIYCLILYIGFLVCKPVAITLFDEKQCYRFMKQTIFDTIPVVEYIHKQRWCLEKSDIVSMIKGLVTTPVQTFLEVYGTSGIASGTVVLWGDPVEEKQASVDGAGVGQSVGEWNNMKQNGEKVEQKVTECEGVNQELPALEEPVVSSEGIGMPEKQNAIDRQQLNFDYLMSKYYTVVSGTHLTPEDMPVETLLNMDLTMKQDNHAPQILIYHTHGMEMFKDSNSNDRSTGIVGVGRYLASLLRERYGYNVIHLESSFDYVNGKLDRSKAYDYAYAEISQVLANHPSIEVVLDLHRDGVGENVHLLTEINGKPTAQIMFFNGISRLNGIGEIDYLYNPYRTENLALSLQMKIKAEEYYSGFTRRNYIQAYQYNLHVRPKSMLIEAGAQTNTFEEVKNAMEPLAALLYMELEGK